MVVVTASVITVVIRPIAIDVSAAAGSKLIRTISTISEGPIAIDQISVGSGAETVALPVRLSRLPVVTLAVSCVANTALDYANRLSVGIPWGDHGRK